MMTQQSRNRLRIAYLTQLDPLDKRSWSSALYYMRQTLQQYCGEVTNLGPLHSFTPTFLSKVRAKSSLALFKRRYLHWTSVAAARQYGREATQKLAGRAFDVIVAGNCGMIIPYLETNIPIVLVADCVLTQMLDYHPYFTRLSRHSIHEIHALEQQALKKASAVIMTSEWAAASAIQDYHVAPEHVHVVSLGANLDHIPSGEQVLVKRPSRRCRLLFIGVEWERKGGDIAFETLLKLEEMGINTELIVCGSTPPPGITHEHLTVIPFLDKNDARQVREIEKLYAMSDFLILPTRVDCVSNVIGEANAFGVPIIITDTGGVADAVRDGENGYALPFEAQGEAYAQLIMELYQDEHRYLQLVQSSRAAFEERLNWDVWGRRVHDILLKECLRDDLVETTRSSETQ